MMCLQFDKVRDVKVRESEDSILEFEAKYQQLAAELKDLQESYSSESIGVFIL